MEHIIPNTSIYLSGLRTMCPKRIFAHIKINIISSNYLCQPESWNSKKLFATFSQWGTPPPYVEISAYQQPSWWRLGTHNMCHISLGQYMCPLASWLAVSAVWLLHNLCLAAPVWLLYISGQCYTYRLSHISIPQRICIRACQLVGFLSKYFQHASMPPLIQVLYVQA